MIYERNCIIKLKDFLKITKNVCASYNEMIKLLTKPNDFISVFKMLEIVYVHIECIKPLNQILDSLLILSCINWKIKIYLIICFSFNKN